MRSADAGSSAREVTRSRIRRSSRWWARNTTRSRVVASAQCRSSNTSSTGVDAARSVSRASVSSNTCTCEPALPAFDPQRVPERTQGLDDRLERQLRADEIDRATEQDVELRAGTPRELGCEPGLADAGFSSDKHGRTTPGSRRLERTLQFTVVGAVRRTPRSCETPFRPVSPRGLGRGSQRAKSTYACRGHE